MSWKEVVLTWLVGIVTFSALIGMVWGLYFLVAIVWRMFL